MRYRALAVRYAQRATRLSEVYHRWPSYRASDGPLDMAYYFWVLQPVDDAGEPPVIVDCGFDPALAASRGRPCLRSPAEALDRIGVDPRGVRRLILTHLHFDHIGNLGLFPNARITVARREFEFWLNNPLAKRCQFAEHTDPDGLAVLSHAAQDDRVDLIEHEQDIAGGLTALCVGGHSPGQTVLAVAGENGLLVLASDAIHYADELELDRPFAVFSDLTAMYAGYDTLRALAARGAVVVPGHDPGVMERFPAVADDPGLAVCLTDTRSPL